MAMKINILKKGDEVLSVNPDFVVVKRKNGEVDIIPFEQKEGGWRIDTENITTIGYGENTIEAELKDGTVTVTTF